MLKTMGMNALPSAEEAAKMGARPLAPTTPKVEPVVANKRAGRQSRTFFEGRSLPRFELDDLEGWLEGRRDGLPAKHSRRLRRSTATDELDLHGMTAAEAERRLHHFLTTACTRGHRLVRIIVGKGRRGPGGRGVLRTHIASWLTDPPAAYVVRAFVSSKAGDGGDGAILVELG